MNCFVARWAAVVCSDNWSTASDSLVAMFDDASAPSLGDWACQAWRAGRMIDIGEFTVLLMGNERREWAPLLIIARRRGLADISNSRNRLRVHDCGTMVRPLGRWMNTLDELEPICTRDLSTLTPRGRGDED
jgi:hypothetical protein